MNLWKLLLVTLSVGAGIFLTVVAAFLYFIYFIYNIEQFNLFN